MRLTPTCVALALCAFGSAARADENLFGYLRGSEVLPRGSAEFYQWVTQRNDKGAGTYRATDTTTEIEYGVTDRFQISGEISTLSIDTRGLLIDGYLPGDKKFTLRPQALEAAVKYNFLSPAKDDFGLSLYSSFEYGFLDIHSGRNKKEYELETQLLGQKYFLEGQLTWVTNLGVRAAYENRGPIGDLPPDFDWPTAPEMEINLKGGTGVAYRFAPNWYAGIEGVYETEFETEVGQERWSVFAGPTIHYGGQKWWSTVTYFPQLKGGGEKYPDQTPDDLHLIEKTRYEARLKLGYNF